MSFAIAAEVQTLLEGVPLPASKRRLVSYAESQGADERLLGAVRSLPDREYRLLDEVGEELAGVQPRREQGPREPRAESGEPPGGDDYTRIPTDTGKVRA